MEMTALKQLANIFSPDGDLQNTAYYALMAETKQPVPWSYEAWDRLVAGLSHRDNHVRAISSQVLCNLAAKSDPEMRILRDFPVLLQVTRDERFVTARHCLQSLWKIGLAGLPQRRMLLGGLELRYNECAAEKNCTLIRFDILQGMRNLFEQVGEQDIRDKALAWISLEEDLKYRRKYAGVWRVH